MKNVLLATTLAFILAGCDSPLVGAFGNMFTIRKEVQKLVTTGDVAVNISNGVYLSVSIINSALNEKSSEARKAVSDKIAKIAYDKYEARKNLREIYVIFASHERKYLIVNYNSTIDSFNYRPSDLKTESQNSQTKTMNAIR